MAAANAGAAPGSRLRGWSRAWQSFGVKLMMKNEDAQFNRRLAFPVLASFAVFACAVVLRLGIGATPYETTDSAGRPMGFNDRLHGEHYLIILRNFSPTDLLSPECVYEWILLVAHLVGAGILLNCRRVGPRLCRWFFLAQAAVFPVGLLALPFLPFLVASVFTGGMDREGFIDIPFIAATAHPVWVVTSLTIAMALRGTGLGLSRVWGALTRAIRTGTGTFAKAMR